MKRVGAALIGLLCVAAPISDAAAQSRNVQLNCAISINRKTDSVQTQIVLRALQPTRADWKLTILQIDENGTGATDQSGSVELDVGRSVRVGRRTHQIAPKGWLEFRLKVKERLTGSDCEALEIVSPM